MKKTNLCWVTLFLIVLCSLLAFPRAAHMQAAGPELPRVFLDTGYVPPTGATINVAAGGDFQAALNAANPGDTIVLQAGATYTTPPDGFVLPNKPGAAWIVIRTSNLGGLPAEGIRVSPASAAAMPKLVTPGLWPAVKTAAAAHHYRFIGVEFLIATAQAQNYGIVTLGEGSGAQSSLGQVPHDLILDRCYIHGNAVVNVSRGVALNSARTAIIDSYIADCHGVGFDTQAIAGWNGPGPFKIVNNYLEGAAENVIFGGSPPAIANLIASDIEFRRNTCYKPLTWKPNDPVYAGTPWSVKNLLELKNAQRVLIDGNTFENIWVSGQSGFAIQWTPRGESGATPWAVVQDITFSNNVVRHAAAGINLLGYDDLGPSQQTRRVRIANNLFEDIGGARWGGNGRFLQILDGTADVAVEHNTVLHTAQVIITEGRAQTGFVYRDNLSRHNDVGVVGTGSGTGFDTLNRYFPGCVFAKNLLAGGPAQVYPGGNFFPATLDDVGFVDLAGGNYRLSATSPYKGAGTDGRDIGADIDAIAAALISGGPPAPAVGLSYFKTDFDGDNKSDLGFYRAGLWGLLKSGQGYSTGNAQFFSWGGGGLQPILADFDGDGKADLAYLVPPVGGQSAAYAILKSSANYAFSQAQFAVAGYPSLGDTPVVADLDGDGKADPGIWRSTTGVWIIPKSSANYASYIFAQWGQLGDTPVLADVDGDGKADIGFYHDGLWGFLKSTRNFDYGQAVFFSWGGAGLQPLVADFDGDGKADLAYMVPPAGNQSAAYAILKSSTNYAFNQALFVPAGFPSIGDTPVVGDFDGDGKADPGIWRESQGVWIIPKSSSNYASYIFIQWGQSGDLAFPNTTGRH